VKFPFCVAINMVSATRLNSSKRKRYLMILIIG
jgi:hypothetical protein